MCALALGRSTWNSAGSSKRRGSRLAAPLSSMTGVPGGDVDPADRGGPPGEAEVGLDRALDPQGLLDEARDALVAARSSSCSSGYSDRYFNADGEQPCCRLLAGREQEVAVRTTEVTSGMVPSGIRGLGQVGQHVVAGWRRRSSMYGGEPFVEPRQCVEPGLVPFACADFAGRPAQAEDLPERLVVLLGHAEQVGHHQHGEGLGIAGDELAPAVGRNSSNWWSAARHMNASLSLRRLGVISRISSARSRVWSAGPW